MISEKLTGKARTPIPLAVRSAVHLTAGDPAAHAIEGDRVILTRAPAPRDAPCACFEERAGAVDSKDHAGS